MHILIIILCVWQAISNVGQQLASLIRLVSSCRRDAAGLLPKCKNVFKWWWVGSGLMFLLRLASFFGLLCHRWESGPARLSAAVSLVGAQHAACEPGAARTHVRCFWNIRHLELSTIWRLWCCCSKGHMWSYIHGVSVAKVQMSWVWLLEFTVSHSQYHSVHWINVIVFKE